MAVACWCPTGNDGLYFTTDLYGAGPVWTLKNAGLATTVIEQFSADRNAPESRAVLIDNNSDVWLWDGATWTEILDIADAIAELGDAAALPFWVDFDWNDSDIIYVYYISNTQAVFLWTDDDGTTWNTEQAIASTMVRAVGGNFYADGQTIVCTYARDAEGVTEHRISYTVNGGALWQETASYGIDAGWSMYVQASRLDSDTAWFNGQPLNLGGGSTDMMQLTPSTGAVVTFWDGLNIGTTQAPQNMMFSADALATQRRINADTLYRTANLWVDIDPFGVDPITPTGGTILAFDPEHAARTIIGRTAGINGSPEHVMYLAALDAVLGIDLDGNIDALAGVVVPGLYAFVAGTAPSGATIAPDSANTNLICENQSFTVTVAAGTAPFTYAWSTDGLQSGQGTATAVYMWSETCPDKTITVTVSNAYGSTTASYSVELKFTYMQICTAIKDTFETNMSAALLERAYNYDQIPEGIQDYPSFQVYWVETQDVDALGTTNRFTFGADGVTVAVKDMIFNVDYVPSPANHIEENFSLITQAASEMHDILESEALLCATDKAHCPPFSLCGLKSFQWRLAFVTFEYGAVLFRGVRAVITTRAY